jgi:hypothetical protein
MQANKSDDSRDGSHPDEVAISREDALNGLRKLGWTLPPDYRLSRDQANQRGRKSP